VSLVAAAAPDGGSRLVVEHCDVGEVYAFNSASCDISLTNIGESPIRIRDIRPASANNSVTPSEIVVAPHSQAYLNFRFDVGNGLGSSRHLVRFHTDEKGWEDRSAAAPRVPRSRFRSAHGHPG